MYGMEGGFDVVGRRGEGSWQEGRQGGRQSGRR